MLCQFSALGDASGDDLVVVGSVSSAKVRLGIAPLTPNSIVLSWPTNAGNAILQANQTVDQPLLWTPVPANAQLQGDQWIVALPLESMPNFFRLAQ